MKQKNVAILGIFISIAYFVTTFIFIITSSSNWLKAMEIITIISGIYMIPFFVTMPYSADLGDTKKTAIVFAAAGMILTSAAHTINLTVTIPLINQGVNVPEYLQIGQWPSVEMVIDYLAWGLFIGLAFMFSSSAINSSHNEKILKIILSLCGVACLAGFLGAIIANEYLWYIAPMGYGIGTFTICIKLCMA